MVASAKFTKTHRIRTAALIAGAAWLGLVLPGPARADDWWNTMLRSFGWGQKPMDETIDYSARPALVVPPSMDLPPPQTASAHPADWPQDPDAAARHRAEADSRRPAPPTPPPADAGDDSDQADQADQGQAAQTPAAPKTQVQNWVGSQSAGLSGAGTSIFGGQGGSLRMPDWNLSSWDVSKWNPFGPTDDSKAVHTLRVGVEPPRQYLTQPPPGYEAPVAVDSDATSGASDTPPETASPVSDNK